jgi:hypothetical protein
MPRASLACAPTPAHTHTHTQRTHTHTHLQVRQYVYQQLARQLRPELEAVVAANDVPPGTPYAFNAAESGRRSARNMAESILGSLPEPDVQERLLRRWVGGWVCLGAEPATVCLLARGGRRLSSSPPPPAPPRACRTHAHLCDAFARPLLCAPLAAHPSGSVRRPT